ncbi:MAG: YIP1 family protein [Bacteroidales bacterium]|jgi:hypothetical protein|nr:YIP1 family protein [Bacteroidales bacterium]
MDIAGVFYRIRNLLLHPATEWEAIASEDEERTTVFKRFIVPLFCLIVVCCIVGSLLFASRMYFSFGYVVQKVAVLLLSLSTGLYISSFLINETMFLLTGTKNPNQVFSLLAYSSGVVYLVISVVELFPFFNELLVLSLYSIYLYWRGIHHLLKIPVDKQITFIILSFVVMVLVYLLAFYFFGNIMKAIFL